MRLLSLDLERYGPFTGRRVDFRPDARLHVVLGPNEAGKSSALAAVTDLLFGIETRTAYAFLHEMPHLRIGAEIGGADGRRLAFRRRKGNRNTLVDADDAPLSDAALTPFLGGLTREVFCRAFGLDANSLRAGAREMLLAEGELGASLFAAASGLRGYSDLQKSLDAESETIFAPRRAQGRSFYQALDRYDEARKAIRDTGLRGGEWRELNEAIAAAGTSLDAIKAERMRIAAEQARLTRLKRVGPLIAAIDAVAARLDAEADLVAVSDAWIGRLGDACIAVREGRAEAERREAAAQAAQAAWAAVAVDAGLVSRADEILEGFRGIDRFDKNGADLPRIQGEADQFHAELARLSVRVGLPDVEALTRRQPSDAARARVEGLIREGQDEAAAIARLERDLAAARAEHEGFAREVAEGGAPVDPAPLREALKPLLAFRTIIAERDALDATVRRAEQVLRGQAARLFPPIADLAALADAPLPTPETVARFRALLEEKERERALAAERRDAAERTVAARRLRLREREAGRPIVTQADLSAIRIERDAAFAPLREALAAGTRSAGGEVAAYERLTQAADRLADEIAADAARVAEHAADRRRLEAEEAEADAAAGTLAAIEAEAAEGRCAWEDLWRPAGIEPATPAEMAAWLGEAEALIESKDALDERRIERTLRAERIETARAPLLTLAARAGLTDRDGSETVERLDVALILGRLEERVAAIASRWETTREANARVGAAAAGIARFEASLTEARARQEAWRRAWTEAVRAIGLDDAPSTAMAAQALAAWQAVPNALAERENRRGRVAGIRRDMERYEAAVTPLIAALAPDLAPIPPSAAIRSLQRRLQEAQASETRRRELGKRRDEMQRDAEAARVGHDDRRAALARLLAETRPEPRRRRAGGGRGIASPPRRAARAVVGVARAQGRTGTGRRWHPRGDPARRARRRRSGCDRGKPAQPCHGGRGPRPARQGGLRRAGPLRAQARRSGRWDRFRAGARPAKGRGGRASRPCAPVGRAQAGQPDARHRDRPSADGAAGPAAHACRRHPGRTHRRRLHGVGAGLRRGGQGADRGAPRGRRGGSRSGPQRRHPRSALSRAAARLSRGLRREGRTGAVHRRRPVRDLRRRADGPRPRSPGRDGRRGAADPVHAPPPRRRSRAGTPRTDGGHHRPVADP